MAVEIIKTKSINITASFASKQYTFVKIDSNGTLASPSAGGQAIGVIQDNPATAGDPGAVCYPGDITKIRCNGSFNPGDLVMSTSGGLAVVAASGNFALGVALTAGSVGFLAEIIFQPLGAKL